MAQSHERHILMPKPNDRFTAAQQEILNCALRALATEQGLNVHFDIAERGSMEACRVTATRFRNNFNNLKAKIRRFDDGRRIGDGLDDNDPRKAVVKSIVVDPADIDTLGCYLEQTETGWQARLIKAREALGPLRMTDIATGEQISA
jgi:hypothetical protein